MTVHEVEEAEGGDVDVELHRVEILADGALLRPASQKLPRQLQMTGIHGAGLLRGLQVTGFELIFAVEQADEVGVGEVVVPGELNQPEDGLVGRKMIDLEGGLLPADVLVGAFEHGGEEVIFIAEVVVEHLLVDVGGLGDAIDAGSVEAHLGEVRRRRVEDALAGGGGVARLGCFSSLRCFSCLDCLFFTGHLHLHGACRYINQLVGYNQTFRREPCMSAHERTRPVAIVTGALRGIGRACAVGLAGAGFDLVLNDLVANGQGGAESSVLAGELAAQLAASGSTCVFVPGDVSLPATHDALLQAALDGWGDVDCLVNNAGIPPRQRGDLLDVTPESFDACMAVNTRAVFFLSQLVARHMVSAPRSMAPHRSIVNITSSNAVAVSISRGEYCVSKAASSMTTKLFALRLAEAGIGVYEVRPGLIETQMTMQAKARYDAMIADHAIPAERWGQPSDVASTVVCMAEGRLPYTVGQAVTVDGGFILPRF